MYSHLIILTFQVVIFPSLVVIDGSVQDLEFAGAAFLRRGQCNKGVSIKQLLRNFIPFKMYNNSSKIIAGQSRVLIS